MDISRLEKISDVEWRMEPHGKMNVPAILFASETLLSAMDIKVYEQISNIASLPGIVEAAYAMPDAHSGYGFPIGGVAAFDPNKNGVISAGGVGFDISCGVRLLITKLNRSDIELCKEKLADELFANIPAGVGSESRITLSVNEINEMLLGGARWAVSQGYGEMQDLDRIEETGCVAGANPDKVSAQAKKRQRKEMGSLGSGNHYLEIQEIAEIYDNHIAAIYGLVKGEIVISIHCGSRGLGHQIGTDYLKLMAAEAKNFGIILPDRELACAPLSSPLGQDYLGAMRAGINCALANREILTHFVREIFAKIIPGTKISLLYDVSHNTCKEEVHEVNGKKQSVFVHRKGATRSFGPGRQDLPQTFMEVGQPVIIGGSMGTSSYVLAGTTTSEKKSFSSACHGAGRAMSRTQARKKWQGRSLVDQLANRGIYIRSESYRGVAEEAPEAYKDVDEVIDVTDAAGLAKKVARLIPIVCIKG